MMNNVTVSFWLRATDKQKQLPEADFEKEQIAIYCKVYLNGCTPHVLSTGEKIEKSRWADQEVIVSGNKFERQEANLINQRLANIRQKFKAALNKLEDKPDAIITLKGLVDVFLEKGDIRTFPTVLSIFDAYLKDCRQLRKVGEISLATLTKKERIRQNMELFIKDFYGYKDVYIVNMLTDGKREFAFAKDFMLWGKTKEVFDPADPKKKKKLKGLWDHNYCAKQLSITKSVIDHGVVAGLYSINPLYKKIPNSKKRPPKFLKAEEVDLIEKQEFLSHVMNTIKDVFLFSCYTGLAFKEVEALEPDCLTISMDPLLHNNPAFTKHWLYIKRQKTLNSTDRECRIPLLKKAYDILQKYKDNPVCLNRGKLLPVMTNQKYNEYLKQIQQTCDLKKNLSTHVARHTCSRIFLDNGFTDEFVSKMFGHATTKYIGTIYGEISEKRMTREIDEVTSKANVSFQ